jgi:hypothetical protein
VTLQIRHKLIYFIYVILHNTSTLAAEHKCVSIIDKKYNNFVLALAIMNMDATTHWTEAIKNIILRSFIMFDLSRRKKSKSVFEQNKQWKEIHVYS